MGFFHLHGDVLAWATIVSCSLAMLLFGYDQGVMRYERRFELRICLLTTRPSGLITSDNFKIEIFKTSTPSTSLSGLVVAIYEIGAFVGSISVMTFGMMTKISVDVG